MPTTVVIPAHNEESVVVRCLEALLTGAEPEELDVVVVCNGCDDQTAELARSTGVRVIETPVASKTLALNLGEAAVSGFPRFYVDADVVLPLEELRRVVDRLERTGAPAGAPVMDVNLSRSTWPVRAYYRIWTQLPYVREGMIGVGVYALSRQGRLRFGEFPSVIADDGFVRMLFTVDERVRVDDARVRVNAPERLSDLVRIKTRSRLGGYQLEKRFPDLAVRERREKSYSNATRRLAVRPWLWPYAIVYVVVQLTTRRRARRRLSSDTEHVWERDISTRREDG